MSREICSRTSIAPSHRIFVRPSRQKTGTEHTQNRAVASFQKLALVGPSEKRRRKCLPQLVRPALTAAVHASCINILPFLEGGGGRMYRFLPLSFDINIPGTGERSAWIPVRFFMNIYLLCCGLFFFPSPRASSCCVGPRGACRLSFPLDFGRALRPPLFVPAASRDTSVRITRPA
jgi:hypothetical protein